ncbi:hypothetical protein [Sphaerisporangium corydalis]|uniref:Uncharacterized protein n=1 Tax=Sphaerisporangium corydalis TaxID=1441875 RepID=A0ABV9EM91_9ACTN|nr:hypothetical protein [Sphaerisporangium corydalis]
MADKQTLKQQLPHPYNQDLSQVLRRLDRRTAFSRTRLANDPVTAAYIAAAMRLVERHLGPDATRTLRDSGDETSIDRPVLSFLSQRTVAAEVNNNPDPFPQMGSVSTMRSTWRSHSDFIADLLRFGLWSKYQPSHCDVTETADVIEQLIDGPHFVEAMHELGYRDLMTFIDRPKFRLELIAVAAADGDDTIRQAMAENHHGLMEPWIEVCAEILRVRGLQLRTGMTLDMLVTLMTAITEGVALRALIDPEVGIVDHRKQRSLLGTGLLALILGCVERTDDADELSLEEAVSTMVYDLSSRLSGAPPGV